MMLNLFSLFDPSLSLMSFFWLGIIVILVFLPSFFWSLGSILYYFFSSLILSVKSELNFMLKKSPVGTYVYMMSIFMVAALFNFLALFPFFFSVTSHMLVTLPLSFSLWLGIVLFSLKKSISNFLSHLIPSGTPTMLISFMVLVETLSNLIRPLALTFRLTANMMAGHLLMSLIGGALIILPLSLMLFGSLVQSLLVLMEVGVSLIQAYVLATLLLLYMSEMEH